MLAVTMAMATWAWGDEFTDSMEKAVALYKKGNYLAAQKELSRAGKLLEPKATAQIPPPTVKDLTFINYEQGFRVSAPNKEWRIQPLVAKATPEGVTTLATMSYGDVEAAEIAIYYVRDLRQTWGKGVETLAGNETATLHASAQNATKLVGNLHDCSEPTIADLVVGGKPGVSSEFTGKREATPMRCRVVQVLVGEKLFTGIFLSTEANWAERSKDFSNMMGTMSFDVPMPEPVLQPTGKSK